MPKRRWKMHSSDNQENINLFTLDSDNIRKKYPFLTDYFTKGIENPDKNVAHSILFYGSDIKSQFELALEVARILNCTGTRSTDCSCLNCRWIRENKHPAVLTISRLDNRAPEDEGKAGNNISVDQARMIKNELMIMSDYHRVLIFCDRDKDGNISGLNEVNFPEIAANALLKTFEEPPAKTTFFFLTKDRSDVITTIVSRCQCFFVPSMNEESRDFSLVKNIMENYLERTRNEVLDFNDELMVLLKENNPSEIFMQMQNYMTELLKSNHENKLLAIKLIKDINSVEKAKKEYKLNMNIQTISENLAFDLILN